MGRVELNLIVLAAGVAMAGSAAAALPPDYDFDWAVIDDPGNPAYDGFDPTGRMAGRGSVGYTYRISKLEVTTAQWVEFVNTFSTQSDDNWLFARPTVWGAVLDGTYQGPGVRWVVSDELPNASRLPVAGISWREAAQYCNWLHNNKASTPEALTGGAYDTSTWGDGPGRTFTDDPTHLPGARFWIPTLDEWMKATHFDPDRGGPGVAGWWMFPNGSDSPLVSGRPEDGGQTSAGHGSLGFEAFLDFPLGIYPDVQSPWELLDVSGGTCEWVEEIAIPDEPAERGLMGSWVTQRSSYITYDRVWAFASAEPGFDSGREGLRIVSSIPSPSVIVPLVASWVGISTSRRRVKTRSTGL